jgi:hypothetical protein
MRHVTLQQQFSSLYSSLIGKCFDRFSVPNDTVKYFLSEGFSGV